jgi:hypothetical protein
VQLDEQRTSRSVRVIQLAEYERIKPVKPQDWSYYRPLQEPGYKGSNK